MKYIRFNISDSGVAEIIFDNPDEKVNTLSSSVMRELASVISDCETRKIRCLVFKSDKLGIFIAGADIREIGSITSAEEASEKSEFGQVLFRRIATLPFPVIAVINGACLGGGLELALACTFRIVTDNPRVQLGLPETTLGIIPGFGGTIRLPRLVGLTHAVEMIVSGKPANARKALKIRLADRLFPEAFLDAKVKEFITQISDVNRCRTIVFERNKKSFAQWIMESVLPVRRLFFRFAKKQTLQKTRGFYPAQISAIDSISRSFGKRLGQAQIIERKYFSQSAISDSAKKLTVLFFAGEELKKSFQPDAASSEFIQSHPIKSACVLGAGKMGGGIAWLFSNADIPIRMKDVSWNAVASGYKAVNEIYSDMKKIKKYDAREISLKLHKVTGTIDYSGISNTDLVIEAITEDKALKIKILNELESHVRDDTVIATNTSSLTVEELSSGLVHPERFVGFHFFNPVNRMPLIEVVRGPKSSEQALFRMIDLARKLRKTPILVNDCPGFLVNRILMNYLDEAIRLFESGVDFEIIDKALYDFGFPMGPFTLLDEIGIKVGYKVARNLLRATSPDADTGNIFSAIGSDPDIFGRSTGKGFFVYQGSVKNRNPSIDRILKEHNVTEDTSVTREEIVERCMYRMINESAQCLEESVIDTPAHLDMALILGIGFPPFRGGILRYADDIGIDKIFSSLTKYKSLYGSRFTPCRSITSLNSSHARFYL